MEEFKIDYIFNLEDFKRMEDIEHSYFTNDCITPANECLKWYNKNNLTCVGVRNMASKVIASVSILPLKQDIFEDICNNKMNEAEVLASQIEEYEDNKSYYIYLSSISIDENYRNNYKVITTLLKGCTNLFSNLQKKNISISKVMADASTIHGEKICKKLFKMECIKNTSHNSNIYLTDGTKFCTILNKLKERL